MLSGLTAMNVWATNRWSSSNARSAAFCPAASPSNVKMISPVVASVSSSSRRSTPMWSPPNEVPQVATAVGTPARWQAITSVYPSTITARPCLAISRLARSIPYRTWDFL